jgi:hypothetical protein
LRTLAVRCTPRSPPSFSPRRFAACSTSERGWLELHESGSFVRFHAGWQRSVRLKQEPTGAAGLVSRQPRFPCPKRLLHRMAPSSSATGAWGLRRIAER